jgi:molecular chaperone DnaJ
MARDYYDVLGVRRDARENEIKHAFRARSRALHPDVSRAPDADARFRELSEAYAVLSRRESRRLYDRFGWRGRGRGFDRRRGRRPPGHRGLLQDLESLFMSAAGRRAEPEPAQVVGSVEVDAYEAYVGATRRLEVGEERRCAACAGLGRRKVVAERDAARFVSFAHCRDCGGTGVAEERRALEVPIPARVRDLDRVRVGPDQVAVVKIVAAPERAAVRAAAFAGLLLAIGFLLFLLAL